MGFLRFLFVLAVLHAHFVGINFVLHHELALFGFFTLSGFLITRIICEVYNDGWAGKRRYITNRFLRIYPIYWVCLFISLLCVCITPNARYTHGALVISQKLTEWIPQITIVGLNSFSGMPQTTRLLPPAWSLSTELFYYVIIGLVVGRSKRMTVTAFGLSILILVHLFFTEKSWEAFYFTIKGPAAVFFWGAICYHFRDSISRILPVNFVCLLLLSVMVLLLPDVVGIDKNNLYFHIAALYSGGIAFGVIMSRIYVLTKHRKASAFEQFLADLSYPMFLVHWPIAASMRYWLNIEERQGYELFGYATLATLLVSMLIVILVDEPIKKLRDKNRTPPVMC